ncbi:MAG: Myo-inositol 2-dehydrogenase [Pseudomonas sp.]|nr:MAG: Myo-inositol 2-dehydrogenase [Pseudomonas sp.]
MKRLASKENRLRLGFVGGALDSVIGNTHRYAANLDGEFELVAGVFSRDPERNLAAAQAYGIESDRVYPDYKTMAQSEAARPDGIQVAAIMTPNATHVPACRTFIEQGIDVICDKPLSTRLDDAQELASLVQERKALLFLTHAYAGYPMVREAREQITKGAIGTVRLVQVEHAGAFGVHPLEQQGNSAFAWPVDPAQAGVSAVLADVGTHAHHLARFVTGDEVTEVSAELSTLVKGRGADDNAHVLLRFGSGARGMLWASFIAAGNRQGLRLRVFGSGGSLEWNQEEPDNLLLRPQDGPHQVLRRGEPWLGESAKRATRLKAGQPEGMLEAFANIYSDAAEQVRARLDGRLPSDMSRLCPTVADGVHGMAFIDACVTSHQSEGRWTQVIP